MDEGMQEYIDNLDLDDEGEALAGENARAEAEAHARDEQVQAEEAERGRMTPEPRELQGSYTCLSALCETMAEALEVQASWRMRDGTPCACPAGRNEDVPKGKMPRAHSTACSMLRSALSEAETWMKEQEGTGLKCAFCHRLRHAPIHDRQFPDGHPFVPFDYLHEEDIP